MTETFDRNIKEIIPKYLRLMEMEFRIKIFIENAESNGHRDLAHILREIRDG